MPVRMSSCQLLSGDAEEYVVQLTSTTVTQGAMLIATVKRRQVLDRNNELFETEY